MHVINPDINFIQFSYTVVGLARPGTIIDGEFVVADVIVLPLVLLPHECVSAYLHQANVFDEAMLEIATPIADKLRKVCEARQGPHWTMMPLCRLAWRWSAGARKDEPKHRGFCNPLPPNAKMDPHTPRYDRLLTQSLLYHP